VRNNVLALNPDATMIEGASPIFVDNPQEIRGKRGLAIEDGPTLMAFVAGWTAQRHGAAEIVVPRGYAVGSIQDTCEKYPDTGNVLPAMGYGQEQVLELEETINNADVDLVPIGSPIDPDRLLKMSKPSQCVRYELQIIGQPNPE
jgi:predicted GTPase